MRILIVHPTVSFQNYNSGDFLTFLGGRSLLYKLFSDVQMIYLDWNRAILDIDSYLNLLNYGDIDIITIMGLPCFSCCKENSLIKIISKLRIKFGNAKFIALGIGQSYGFPLLQLSDYMQISYVEQFRDFFAITTRDFLAHKILEDNNIPNMYFYDMSIFAYELLNDWNDGYILERNPLSIFLPPPSIVQDEYMVNEIIKTELDFIRENKPLIITLDISNKDRFKALYGIDVIVVDDINYLVNIYKRSSKLLTTRIHQAILGMLMGATSFCIAVDMRYLTLCPFDIEIINTGNKPLWIPQTDLLPFSLSELINGVYTKQVKDYFDNS